MLHERQSARNEKNEKVSASKSKNAVELLKSDHKKVRELLTELAESTARATKKRSQLLAEIAMELEIHTTIEEEIFYPAFKQAGEGDSE